MANIGRSWVQSTRNGRLIGSEPVLVRENQGVVSEVKVY